MDTRRVVGLGVLVAALAAPVGAQQPTQVAAARPRTIDAVASPQLQQPDQRLYDAIARLDPKKAEEMNAARDYAGVLGLLRDPMSTITQYGIAELDRLPERDQATIAYAANELGIALRRGKKDERQAFQFFRLAVDLNTDLRLVDNDADPNTPLVSLGM